MSRTTPNDPEQHATAADALLRALEADGVEVVFGLPGGAALPLYDALARGTSVRHVLARHEQGAGHMAQGYARASGKVGVVFATSGPGATNLVTPIADAWSDSTPLVCITGQVATPAIGTRAFQETDIVSVVRPITKAAWQVRDPRRLASTVRDALRLARTGRHGPVLVDVPKDVQSFTAPLRELLAALAEEPAPPPWRPLDARAVERAARLLAEAERPVLVVGGGVVAAGAAAEVLALAETAGAPVVTTMMAKGAFPETHELHAGIPGMHGTKTASWALDRADLVVGVGTRFDDRMTGRHDGFAPAARIVHLDVDPEELDRLVAADVGIAAPLRPALQALESALRPLAGDAASRLAPWRAQLDEWQDAFPLRYAPSAEVLKPQAVLEALRDRTAGRDDVVFTTGVGQHQMWAMQYLVCTGPRQFVSSGGLGTMGFGLPGRRRCAGRPAGRHGRVRRRRRLVPDDGAGARDGRRRGPAGGGGRRQQRVPRHGAAVAGPLPRRPALGVRADPCRHRPGRAGTRLRLRCGLRRVAGRARAGARRGARGPPALRPRLSLRSDRGVLSDAAAGRGRAATSWSGMAPPSLRSSGRGAAAATPRWSRLPGG